MVLDFLARVSDDCSAVVLFPLSMAVRRVNGPNCRTVVAIVLPGVQVSRRMASLLRYGRPRDIGDGIPAIIESSRIDQNHSIRGSRHAPRGPFSHGSSECPPNAEYNTGAFHNPYLTSPATPQSHDTTRSDHARPSQALPSHLMLWARCSIAAL